MLSPVLPRPSAIAIVTAIGLAFAVSACNASRHGAPIPHVIVIPDPQQVTGTLDTSRMDWLSRFLSTASGTARR